MSGVAQVSDKTDDQKVINSKMPMMIEFRAGWCKPCKKMTVVIEGLAREYQGRMRIVQMNVAEKHETSAKFGIRGIADLILIKQGEAKQIIVGSHPKTYV